MGEAPHLLVAMPCRGEIRSCVVADLLGCMLHAASYWQRLHGDQAIVSFSVHPRAHVVVARNEIVKEALELGAHWVLWLDDDMKPCADLAQRLLETGCEFVGAVAYKREPPFEPCVARLEDGKAVPFDPDPDAGLVAADLTGFACVLTHRRVLELVSARTEGRPFQGKDGVGEDWFFCAHARAAGVQLHIVADAVVGHLTDHVVGRADRLAFIESAAPRRRDGATGPTGSLRKRERPTWPSSPCSPSER